MKNGKFAKRGIATKALVMILAIMMVVGISVGGTLAWLVANTNEVTNTFTVGKIQIELDETVDPSFKVVPGATDDKDPTVTVKSGSENCWVYVLVTNDLVIGNDVVGAIDINTTNWNVLATSGNKTLYCYKDIVDAASADVELPVFTSVTYDGSKITEANIKDLDGKTIVIDAFAHQSDNVTDKTGVADAAAKAWAGIA